MAAVAREAARAVAATFSELRDSVETKENGVVEQAHLASCREAAFVVVTSELRAKVADRDGRMNVVTEATET